MRRERLTMTMILTVVGLALFGMVRPDSPDPVEDSGSLKTWFFLNKTHQDARFDGVVIGDSRALRAVSAKVLSERIGGRRFFNFAFHAGGMNPEMYREAEALLDAGTAEPVIILAPTALSFLPSKAGNAQFHEYRAKPRDLVWVYRHWPGLVHWFRPLVPSVPLRRVLGIEPGLRFEEDYRADGWIATDQDPHDDLTDLSQHRDVLVGRRVDEAGIAAFMDQTRTWTAGGARVFAFFPPAHEPRVAQEDSILGLDREAFVRSFEEAGGVWLDLPREGFDSYDGSHLTRDSALDLSRRLAALIAYRL